MTGTYMCLETASLHLLKAEGQHTLRGPALYQLLGQEHGRGPCGTSIVHLGKGREEGREKDDENNTEYLVQ